MTILRRSIFVLALLLTAASVAAHGGQYRGPPGRPTMPPPALRPPVGKPAPRAPAPRVPLPRTAPKTARPAVGAPAPGGGPTTGGVVFGPSGPSWQTWWEFNKEPFLIPRMQAVAAPVTHSDDFYLGHRRSRRRVDVLQPNDRDRAERILPALVQLIDAERNRDIQSACLVALGKIGVDNPQIDLEQVIAKRIERDDQEVRETAVLALGIAGRRAALPLLADLLGDTPAGRKLADRSEVRGRTRAFAAYALGLLARRLGDPKLSQRVVDLLLPMVLDRQLRDRDLRTAAITALGALRADPERSADKRLAWQTVEVLVRWFEQDLGPGAEYEQAHAAIAIARLLGRGTSPIHRRCKQVFAAMLNARNKRRGPPMLQSCAIALGMLAVPQEQNADDEPFSSALHKHYQDGRDLTARSFSVIALGRIGGASNRTRLAKSYQRANKHTELPWVALALGLLAEPAARAGEPDELLGRMLLEDLQEAASEDQRSALAVALGLTGYDVAVPAVMRLLRDHEGNELTAGYLCISLGLMRDPTAVSQLSAVLQRSQRRPFLLQQCAVALGCLGDRGANEKLVGMIGEGESVAVLAAMAGAIGRIGDRRAIDALVAMSADRDLTKLARAFVAAALGGVGDKDEMPWNVPLTVDSNYVTGVDTLSNGATGVLDIL